MKVNDCDDEVFVVCNKTNKEYTLDINYTCRKNDRIMNAEEMKTIMNNENKNYSIRNELEQELHTIENKLVENARLGLSFATLKGHISKNAEEVLKDLGYNVEYMSYNDNLVCYTTISWVE